MTAFLLALLVGALLVNAVPHLVHGVSGQRFPTPFARPPGRGLSAPLTNVLWALANLAVAGAVYRIGLGDAAAGSALLGGLAAGAALTAIGLALFFGRTPDPRA